MEVQQASAERLRPLIEPVILYFHRKGWQQALREDAVLHVREHAGLLEKSNVAGQLSAAIMFVDLSGFTSLAEAMGDEMAVRVLERFAQIVREVTGKLDGRIVKQIGDAFMIVFVDARDAVAAALDIDRVTCAEPHFPAVRTGIHYGPTLYREGDYLGTSVNIAARLAAEAKPHQVLVTAAVRSAAPGVDFVAVGKRRLRGLADELELFAGVPRHGAASCRLADPVCGMELTSKEAAAKLVIEGGEAVFCSHQCLQRFVATPERYRPDTARS